MKKKALDFEPLHNRVLIKSMDVEETTKGGIIIADVAKEKPQEGTVVAVGKGARTEDGKRIPMDVKVGDNVFFGRYAGSEIKVNQVEYTIMKESDIIGTYE